MQIFFYAADAEIQLVVSAEENYKLPPKR
jgi:hypothetical protein